MRVKYLVFALIAGMMGYVLVHNERFLIEPENPAWNHYVRYGGWLLVHGLAGAAALFLAPFQFSDRLRKRNPKLHRVSGRIYVAGVLILAPLGAYVQYVSEAMDGAPRSFTVLATVDALMLYVTTGIALLFAIQRRLTQHRLWMTRSYAVALVFFEGRFILGVFGLETAGVEIVQAVIWSCLALSLVLADIVNDWAELRRAVLEPATAKVADTRPRATLAPTT